MIKKYHLYLVAALTCAAPPQAMADGVRTDNRSYAAEDYYKRLESFNYLAALDPPKTATSSDEADYREAWLFKPKAITKNQWHQYLGLGSLALAAGSVLMPKEEGGAHEYMAQGAALLGGAAVASGIWIHADDIDLSKGFNDPDNMHALLTTLGALGYLIAVSQAPEGGHSGAGGLGFAAMALGIKIAW